MKLLIAYDGSHNANQICDDLEQAGLPREDVEAVVLSIAEVWMPPPPNGGGFSKEDYPDFINKMAEKRLDVAKNAVQESRILGDFAKDNLHIQFPKWDIKAEATNGSPAWEIVDRAEKLNADLIVVGAMGKSAYARVMMGSISQKVMTEAKCSVRVVRKRPDDNDRPARILIAFDGSPGSILAVNEVASRSWSKRAIVYLLTATHSLLPLTIGRFVPPRKQHFDVNQTPETVWVEKIMEGSAHKLENAGLDVEKVIKEGSPKQVIVEEARKLNIDSIFIGAHSYTGILDRYLIGSTSAAIASRAHCSVETVREKNGDE
jgi:nucleotide-binding universal stress UspA family protein